MSSRQNVTRSASEDKSRNWANNVIEKSAGGRIIESEPKLNWTMVICVAILIIIAIIYFAYSSDSKPKTNDAIGGTDGDAVIPAITDPANTVAIVS